MRLEDWIYGVRGKDLQLASCFLTKLGSQLPVRVVSRISKEWSRRGLEGKICVLHWDGDKEEGVLKHVICYRTGDYSRIRFGKAERKVKICNYPVYSSKESGLWNPRKCLQDEWRERL